MNRLIAFAVLCFVFAVPSASAVVYCEAAGVPEGCLARYGKAAVPAAGVEPANKGSPENRAVRR